MVDDRFESPEVSKPLQVQSNLFAHLASDGVLGRFSA
jgi:hypothetical protein